MRRLSRTRIAVTTSLCAALAAALLWLYQPPLDFMLSTAPLPIVEDDAAGSGPALDEFGLELSGRSIVERTMRRDETFADVLTAHGVAYSDVIAIAEAARPVFDVRRLRRGKMLRIYRDSLGAASHLVYQESPIDYVVFDLGNRPGAYRGKREVDIVRRRVAAVIDNSLYGTLDKLDADLGLAVALSEVYAWQIDFFHLQKGDAFSLVYEEKQVDGEAVGLGKIVAARFKHVGHDFYAFHFDDGRRTDYYDEEGNSLQKAFLKAPLRYKRISSRYTKRRFHPVQKRYKAHLGTDYAADPGTPIRAVGDGVVLEAQYKRYNGNYVKIRHNATYTTGYLHMSRFAEGIRPGSRVRQGDVIGYVGSTGLATGPHLCFRFWKKGVQVDPLKEEFPPAHPVDPAQRLAFQRVRDMLLPQLLPTRYHLATVPALEADALM